LLKALPAVFNSSSNGQAREAAMALLVELHRWVGSPPLTALLDQLRSAQKTEFEKIVQANPASTIAKPSLYLRKERPLPGEVGEEEESSQVLLEGKGKNQLDGREFVDEVDIMKKLKSNNSEFSTLIAEEKWSEQLKGLQLVIDAIGPIPKVVNLFTR
jgi:hypothetical protein